MSKEDHLQINRKETTKMKKYIVKHTSKATKENANFYGQEAIGYYGKDQYLIGYYGDHAKAVFMEQEMTDWAIKEHGYNRRCDAERSYIYRYPENTKYWQSTVEIVEYDI